MPIDKEGNLIPKSFIDERIISRREALIGGASVAAAATAFVAIAKPSLIESVIEFFNPKAEKPKAEVQNIPETHFISPHLGYTLENNFGWAIKHDILGNGSYIDVFQLDPDRTEEEPISPQLTITVTEVGSSMTSDYYAQIWAKELYKLREEDIEEYPPTFQKGPPINGETSILVTTPTIGGLKFHTAIFIKDNISYAIGYAATEDEYYAKDENGITNFNKITLMRGSMEIIGAPEFAFISNPENQT